MNKVETSKMQERLISSPWKFEKQANLEETLQLTERDSNNSLFDLEGTAASDYYEYTKSRLLEKLSIVKLDSISISPSSAVSGNAQHILNLKQEFTFPVSNFIAQNEIGTQTVNLIETRVKTPYPTTVLKNLEEISLPPSRPKSDPTNTFSNHDLFVPRVTADVKPTLPTHFNMCIGDGIENNLKQIQYNARTINGNETQEIAIYEQKPIEELKIKKSAMFCCKKVIRPQTRHRHKPGIENNTPSSSESENKLQKLPMKIHKKSSECSVEMKGNHYQKLSNVVDQLQDHNWEICHEGLKNFSAVANSIYWDSEMGMKFIPIISRKLIDFFKSPRSNLCRTACQIAGEFFLLAKSTKRPEFDEMVDILLCRTADQNRFIQKDANIALDKMVQSIPIQHSIRAVCSKGPDNKNPIVRATTARLLVNICKQAGIEQIVGVEANARTRKRVLTNLAKFLTDKNVETRRHSEKLCKMLKKHKFFNDYFFKEIENNMKVPLRRILNNIN
ncbi:hypothetical protein PVAND_006919 [Polypedilum vanderplanki]|uniref:CLASP N-terminal domain-containing protein n=1 Tax=Polypedilum vanderplanki TaxID=319348 RepID=A0A9J6C4R9_POLVA|nr:hypothetical protein PVAND_006919 [Polypedilum vanderplanki]